MFGFSKGQFGATYDDFLDCVHPRDRQHAIDSIYDAFNKETEYNIEHRIIWADKSIHWVSEKGKVFRYKNAEPIRMLGGVQDITERKEPFERLHTILVFQDRPDQFDLIITDQTMPGMTGAERATRMLQIRPDLPVILCTGYSAIVYIESCVVLFH